MTAFEAHALSHFKLAQIARQNAQDARSRALVLATVRGLYRLATGLLRCIWDVLGGLGAGVLVLFCWPVLFLWEALRLLWAITHALGRVFLEGGDHAVAATTLPVDGP